LQGRILVASVAVAISVLATAAGASAQTDPETLTLTQGALVCGPPVDGSPAAEHALRIIGVQDAVARGMYGPRDLLIIGGGTNAGVQLGQRFYARRGIRFGQPYGTVPTRALTSAVIRIVAVNDTTAIAMVQHVCDAIQQDDYLDPFVTPVVAPALERVDPSQPTGELDFTSLARLVIGPQNHEHGGAGDLMLMDRGSDEGVAAGARYAVYRDLKEPGLPLAAIGEAVVLSTGTATSVVRLTQTRDAVQSGDYLVPRK
jgi:hypothetical protein